MISFLDISRRIASSKFENQLGFMRVLDSGQLILGEALEEFEHEFASSCGAEEAIGVANGLDALYLILVALDIGEGDEVIVPAMTFHATWLAVVRAGATPVPVDVGDQDAMVDFRLVEEAISARTAAIIAVHLYGNSAGVIELAEISRRHGVVLIEDAAQAHGGSAKERLVGSVGMAAAFSFYPTKNLGAFGDAGAVTTSDSYLAKKIRSLRNYGANSNMTDFPFLGINSRLDDVQAAVLSGQLKLLKDLNARRRAIAKSYQTSLQGSSIRLLGPELVDESVWHLAVVVGDTRTNLQRHFLERKIETRIHYPYWFGSVASLGHSTKVETRSDSERFRVSRAIAENSISIPLNPWLSPNEVDQICRALAEYQD